MLTINLGTGPSAEEVAAEFVPLYIAAGGTGTIVAVGDGPAQAGDGTDQSVNYYFGTDAPAAGNIAAGSSATFTPTQAPVYITSNSISSVTLSGPGY